MRDRSGFTLIELLVSLVLGALLVGSVLQLVSGQGRFVRVQGAREEVQQNSRAALELIGSELRSMPPGDALVRADRDSVTFRSARVWGVVCALPAPDLLEVLLPIIPGVSYAPNTGSGVVVDVGSVDTGPLWTDPVPVLSIGGAGSLCGGAPVPDGSERRSFRLSAPPLHAGIGVSVGGLLYFYEEVTYRTGASAGVPGLWIQRRIGTGGNQPMTGPIPREGGGLEFEYFAGSSAVPLSHPLSDPAVRASISRVRVRVESIGRHQATEQISRADTILITLRNRV